MSRSAALNEVYKRAWHAYIQEYKAMKGCQLCGCKETTDDLQFHHIDPSTKKDTVSNLIAKPATITAISAEMDKCILVCSVCHKNIHAKK